MARAWRKPVITVNRKDYGIGDGVMLKLKTGAVIIGIIEDIRFHVGPDVTLVICTSCGSVDFDIDLIDG